MPPPCHHPCAVRPRLGEGCLCLTGHRQDIIPRCCGTTLGYANHRCSSSHSKASANTPFQALMFLWHWFMMASFLFKVTRIHCILSHLHIFILPFNILGLVRISCQFGCPITDTITSPHTRQCYRGILTQILSGISRA